SKFRPKTRIIALTPVPEVARRLTVVWGVEPTIVPHTANVDEMLDVAFDVVRRRSEEHTSELQSRENLVCRLLLEKKKMKTRLQVAYLKNFSLSNGNRMITQ